MKGYECGLREAKHIIATMVSESEGIFDYGLEVKMTYEEGGEKV